MKVLYISEFLFGRDAGCKALTWTHLKALSEVVSHVSVVAIYRDMKEDEINKSLFEAFEEVYYVKAFSSKFENMTNILSLNGWCMNQKIRNYILEIISRGDFDTVFIDDSVLGKLTKQIKHKFSNVKVLTFYHDIKADLSKQWIKNGGLRTIPFNFGIMLNEKINQKNSDCNIVLNDRDEELFMKHYHKPVDGKLPVCVKDAGMVKCDMEDGRKETIDILFIGTYYAPNLKGIIWFIDNIFSKLDNRYLLKIVGSQMERLKQEIELPERVYIQGWVPSLDEVYVKADVVIAPIFEGGGMKIKTAEAFRYGKCFIGTTESYTGYISDIPQEVLGKYLFICDTEEEFLKAFEIIENSGLKKYNEAVRKIYVDFYSEDSARRQMRKLIEQVK